MSTTVLPSVAQSARSTIESIFGFIRAQGSSDYLGEAVSQLEHSLQAADLAQKAGADEETVLATLLHDIGRFIRHTPAADALKGLDGTRMRAAEHDVLGEAYLRSVGFSDKVAQLVGAHVVAKKYLTAVDETYFDRLSSASKESLIGQGGKFTPEEAKAAEKDPLLQLKLAVRRWDDQAKVAGAKTPDLESYNDLAVKCLIASRSKVTLHSRSYLVPRRPTVVICVDGFDPSYLQKGIEDGIIPTFSSFAHNGFHETAKVAMPSFTNPNNVSIITGVPPAIHGIAGNYFLDRETGKEIMIVDDKLLRGSTILEQMSKVGVRIAAVTAKDKLRKILTHGLTLDKNASVCFSAEKAGSCTLEENGISDVEEFVGRPQPPQFSGELSLFVLDAGIRLLEQDRTDLFYLTLSDFIQHTHAPREEESDEFYAALDARVARLVELGAKVAITGDHGMSGKCGADGKPDVVFLQDEIEARFGQGCCRVICPITDPFVRHHAGLGSLVRIYVDKNRTQDVDAMIQFCRNFSQVQIAVSGAEAAEEYEMPLDREGDIVVIASHHAVIGATRKDHNLDDIKDHKLRSHGGLSEAHVPLMMSEPMQHDASSAGRQWRNFDIFDLVLNH